MMVAVVFVQYQLGTRIAGVATATPNDLEKVVMFVGEVALEANRKSGLCSVFRRSLLVREAHGPTWR